MLVTVERYRAITGDETAAASAVEERLDEASERLAEALDRPLELDDHIEQLCPTRDGHLWPRATPIESADGYTIDGAGLVPRWGMRRHGPVSVEYRGGWTVDTVPGCIARDIAHAAQELGRTVAAPDAGGIDVTGASSIRVGDVAVGWSNGRGVPDASLDARVARHWSKATLRYRYRVPRGI